MDIYIKSWQLKAPGPAVHVGECDTKETRTIKQVVLEIWPAQVSCANFVSI